MSHLGKNGRIVLYSHWLFAFGYGLMFYSMFCFFSPEDFKIKTPGDWLRTGIFFLLGLGIMLPVSVHRLFVLFRIHDQVESMRLQIYLLRGIFVSFLVMFPLLWIGRKIYQREDSTYDWLGLSVNLWAFFHIGIIMDTCQFGFGMLVNTLGRVNTLEFPEETPKHTE